MRNWSFNSISKSKWNWTKSHQRGWGEIGDWLLDFTCSSYPSLYEPFILFLFQTEEETGEGEASDAYPDLRESEDRINGHSSFPLKQTQVPKPWTWNPSSQASLLPSNFQDSPSNLYGRRWLVNKRFSPSELEGGDVRSLRYRKLRSLAPEFGGRGRHSMNYLPPIPPRKRQILFRQCFFNPISCFWVNCSGIPSGITYLLFLIMLREWELWSLKKVFLRVPILMLRNCGENVFK